MAPTFTGTVPVVVQGLRWGVAPGSKVRATKGGHLYVLDPSGSFHVLVTEAGKVRELVMLPATAARIEKLVRERYWSS